MEAKETIYPPRALFNDIHASGQYVTVLVPPPKNKTEGGIEIPETVRKNGEKETTDFPVLIHSVGPDVDDNYGPGNLAYVSLFMNQPHQSIVREMENGEQARLFFIDSGMIVGVKTE